MSLVELNASSEAERARIAKHQPFDSLQDFRDRIQSLQAMRGAHGDCQLAHDIQLPPLGYEWNRFKAVTWLELRGRTQTDLEVRKLHPDPRQEETIRRPRGLRHR
jgi:error-prone DNA polymerase